MEDASFLVTGGCGLQGSHVVEKLKDRYPNAKVTVMTRHPERATPVAGVNYLQGDITSPDDVARIFSSCHPTVVFHCAGVVSGAGVNFPPAVIKAINLDGTRYVLEESKRSKVEAFVFTGSSSVAQKANHGLADIVNGDETWPLANEQDGCAPYVTSKVGCELLSSDVRNLLGRSRSLGARR